MAGENKYRKYRLSRRDDGTIDGAKKVSEDKISESWQQQDKNISLKEEFGITGGVNNIKESFKKHKPKDLKYKKKNDAKTGNVNILLSVPKINFPKNALQSIGKRPAILSAVSVIIIGGMAFWVVNGGFGSSSVDNDQSTEVLGEVQESITLDVKPEYAVLSPDGVGAEFAKISPPGESPVYAYTDAIGGIPIKVSQQKLPDSLKEDQANRVKDLAEQFNARDEIFIDEYVAYIGTSLDGPQSVVFVRSDLMILIASDQTISKKEWVEYLSALRY